MKKLLLFFFAGLVVVNAQAQKLPNVQQVSLRVPNNIKIDGRPDEWGKTLQAYNAATEINYSVANDDKNLYLVVQATSWTVITNIANGGIKLAVQKTGEKNDAGAPVIKFPYMVKSHIMIPPKGQANADADAAMREDNKALTKAKWIYTSGITGVDSLISVYNDRGITVAHGVDIKRKYTLEMAIDLSLLNLSVVNASKFSYHLMVNAEPNRYSFKGIMNVVKSISNNTPGGLTAAQLRNIEGFENSTNNSTATTDFWGEYTLAK
ncbi:hypothetical protein ACFQZS_00095 [Mucilaginibacter calamicampi]|uniref:Uncharacterized protein n=1 Tax=Mucilaginibacter calamicampi TaxID=1302352 RepID=A0ABW2YVE8_9SPHI